MANQEHECRPGGGCGTDINVENSTSAAADDFEFRILSSGGLVTAGKEAADMCVADEVFSHGKLLPLRPSSATPADVSGLLLLRSESRSDSMDRATTASTTGFSSRSDSRSASSNSSSCVSRSQSSKSASSDAPPRRSLSSNLFYAYPSPSPQLRALPRRSNAVAPRRSTGSAPPAAWGIIRLGVVGAPDVYPPRAADAKKAAARGGSNSGGGSRSARFEQASSTKVVAMEKKLGVGLLGGGLGCKCSPDAVEPVSSPEVAAAAARRRKKKEEEKKGGMKRVQSVCRSRILEWLEELSIAKEKNVV